MNKCSNCGNEFEGNFCPQCGTRWEEIKSCPKCGNLVGGDANFCNECGYDFSRGWNTGQPSWIKRHKKLFAGMMVSLVLILIISIAVPVYMMNRYNGTYYLYSNGEYDYERYFILNGNSYTDEDGYSCDVKFEGDNIKMYAELFGVKDVTAQGTVKGDVLALNIMGAEVTYVKKGHKHKFKQEIITEPTCEEEGLAANICENCGFYSNETVKLEALGHEFKNGICTRCGMNYTEYQALNLKYERNEDGKEYSVTGIGGCKDDSTLIIPSEYQGVPVTSIGEEAFKNCTKLTSITIPSSVTSIGARAFSGCSALTEIKVNEKNQTYHAAGNCLIETGSKILIAGCKTSEIPDDGSVTSIGAYAFHNCTGLTSITIPDSVTSIEKRAFYDCGGLETAYFESPIGWGITSWEDEDPMTLDLGDPETAAEYLTDTYFNKDWSQNE